MKSGLIMVFLVLFSISFVSAGFGYDISRDSQGVTINIDSGAAGGAGNLSATSGPYLYDDTTTVYFNESFLNNTIALESASASDTNESTRVATIVGSDCAAGNYSYGFDSSGNIQCRDDETGASGGLDGNASSICSNDEVLLGNGSCMSSSVFGTGTGDNATWSESYADNLYAAIQWGYNFTLATFNIYNASWDQSYLDRWNYNQTTATYNLYNDEWSSTYNATYAAQEGNASFNQSLTDSLYAPVGAGSDNVTWNESHADTLYAAIGSGGDNVTWNESYADGLYADISVTGDNVTWNQSHADTLYAAIGVGGDNVTWNESYAYTKFVNGTVNSTQFEMVGSTINLITSWLTSYIDAWLTTSGLINNASYLSTYNATYDGHTQDNVTWNQSHADTLYAAIGVGGDNVTWNESYANGLYAGVEWDYNQSLATFDMWNSTWDVDTDTNLNENEVEAFIFDEDNAANLNISNYNVSTVDCIVFDSGGKICSGT